MAGLRRSAAGVDQEGGFTVLKHANDNERRLLVSFSGGETSGLMARVVKERMAHLYDRIIYVIANTSQENEETLVFADECDRHFGLNLVWVEAEIRPEAGHGTRARVVDFTTASRNGEVFEAMIDKYGIPNRAHPHCSRELKARVVQAYARSIGWAAGSYDTAIGIRVDEIDRISPSAKEHRLIYPLAESQMFPSSKADVNDFWARMPFRLRLRGYQGNCKWCWKKSLRKHLTIISENPSAYDFPERMEAEKGHCGAGDKRRVFFREERSTADLRRLAAITKFTPATDDARQYQPSLFSPFLDVGDGCEDTCEVDYEEAA
ncbi:hypothetical protein QWJ46_00580 [Rhizobium sp. CBN3]|uniref:hypothetical protein n=1 Tax=Rhizobium sp. CBN3 TaxID=3058045 RepID=UPI002673F0C2|nr:hypothetical protein [Rhizobium sp. CBN3]MDO3431169.1 hypothetical protein [Rhizobium sp. CBN3]